MELRELVEQVPSFDIAAPKEQIKLLAWWLHTHQAKELFGPGNIRACYDSLHMSQQAIATYLTRLESDKALIREKSMYKLARNVRADLDKRYGVHQSVAIVDKLLSELPSKVPDLAEQAFLDEALRCYRARAFRACIVMTWNLAFDHLRKWILKDPARVAEFNTSIAKRNPKKASTPITKLEDFEEFSEREVIDICNIAGLYTSDVNKVLLAKLDRRNTAAHPSDIVIIQHQADDVVSDLVNNVVLKLT